MSEDKIENKNLIISVKELVGQLLEESKCLFFLYYGDALIWSNKRKDMIWLRVLRGRPEFKVTKFKLNQKSLTSEIILETHKPVNVNNTLVEIKRGRRVLYRRLTKFSELSFVPGDTFVFGLKFDLKGVR